MVRISDLGTVEDSTEEAKSKESAEKSAFDKAVQAEVTRLLAAKAAQAQVEAQTAPPVPAEETK